MPPTAGSSTASAPRFYFDLASPEAWLVAERVLPLVSVAVEWVPVQIGPGTVDRAAIEDRAAAFGLQAVRWPPVVPFDSEVANRAATFAKQTGRTVAFAQAAFRQAYCGGWDLTQTDQVLIAGSACEMHPRATLKALETRLVRDALTKATAEARAHGVRTTPAIFTGDHVFHGDAALEDAAAVLAEHAA